MNNDTEVECNIFQLYDEGKENVVAQIVEFSDGQVVVKWCGDVKSLVVFNNIKEFEKVSVTPHNRRIIFSNNIECLVITNKNLVKIN